MPERKIVPPDEFSRRRGVEPGQPRTGEGEYTNDSKTLNFWGLVPIIFALAVIVAIAYIIVKIAAFIPVL